jgi:predicted RecB family nuclease
MRLVNGDVTFAATDLSDHLACDHLSTLSRLVARGDVAAADTWDPLWDILLERGRAHEQAYLDFLRASGLRVVVPDSTTSTRELMRSGAAVIAQATLAWDRWTGRADFLVRVSRPSALGDWSYEVHDTKLAADTRAGAVLQVCVYSELVARLQEAAPEYMHIVRPGPEFPRDSFRFDEYAAIYRRLRDDLRRHVDQEVHGYPEPTAHCEVCRWRSRCDDERRRDDHLSLVANMGRLHRRELRARDIDTTTALAAAPLPLGWTPERGAAATFDRLARQARLQVTARSVSPPPVEWLPVARDLGLARLPAPSPGDVFLDLEGDAFIGAHGREYLFGYVTLDRGAPEYCGRWAFEDASEVHAFERIVDEIMARWAADPGMHVYHYAPYETTAFKRLRGHYGTRIQEIDQLLRAKRFIDLYKITRQALLAGVESYSIKALEPIIGFDRELPLEAARPALRSVRLALQRATTDVIQQAWREDVERYNKDDCLAALRLREWLETRRAETVASGESIERPPLLDGSVEAERAATDAAADAITSRLLAGVSPDRAQRTEAEHARWLLGHAVFWHAREIAPEYWDFFRRVELTEDERLDDPKCIAGLTFDSEVSPAVGRRRSAVHRYRFPPQEVALDRDATLYVDADTRVGSIAAIDIDTGTVDVKKARDQGDLHPTSVAAKDIVTAGAKEDAVRSLAARAADGGFPLENEPSLARDLLCRARPRNLPVDAGSIRRQGEPALECALRIADSLDGTVLPIQGPPGSGKTFLAAHLIVELVRTGRRVGITATSHKVIHNLVEKVIEVASSSAVAVRTLVRAEDDATLDLRGVELAADSGSVDRDYTRYQLIAGTAWLWARPGMTGSVDVLVVDEAGQMSLVDTLACCDAARSLVLVGDPQQLQQPIKGTHPDGLAVSSLEHLLGPHETIAVDRGLFLDETHRLHPRICAYTSEQFYESRLVAAPSSSAQRIASSRLGAPGLYWLAVEHSGNQNRSEEEAIAVADLVDQLLDNGASWTDAAGTSRALRAIELRVVAPYNAHVGAIREALAARHPDVPVGTVDKFQGQEGVVAIYSMATSHPEDAPRGLGFLYDRHRLNVATSRARCAAVLVCSPSLLRPTCKTPEHLRLASALARFVEMATAIPSGQRQT